MREIQQSNSPRYSSVPRRRSIAWVILLAGITLGATGCSLDKLLDAGDPPQGTELDPGEVSSYTGAVRIHYSALASLTDAMATTSQDVGLFTDELGAVPRGGAQYDIDSRTYDEYFRVTGVTTPAYTKLHTARIRAAQAGTLLRQYGGDSTGALIGEAYAIQAYAITLLAELFCSGVPLTNVPFEGGLQYTAGLSTNELLERAVMLFDTASQYGADSLPVATFARIGKGRALLDLGRYTEAATAVAGIDTDAQYAIRFSTLTNGVRFWTSIQIEPNYRVLSNEGGTGIQWAAATPELQDPRLPLSRTDLAAFRQQKYQGEDVTMVLANGIQARMIEAEARLQPAAAPAGAWLDPINAARATVGLTGLSDPGSAAGRIDLLFRERGFWFYLNGQRLGDMRRLVRQYNRLPMQVYPTGVYPLMDYRLPSYGTEYVFVPPVTEEQRNPLYTGCIDRRP